MLETGGCALVKAIYTGGGRARLVSVAQLVLPITNGPATDRIPPDATPRSRSNFTEIGSQTPSRGLLCDAGQETHCCQTAVLRDAVQEPTLMMLAAP